MRSPKHIPTHWLGAILPFLCAVALILPGCGSSDSSSPASTPSGTVSGVTSGTITQKGSIFVNGLEFATQGAVLEMDGQKTTLGSDDSMLKIGMQATVDCDFYDDGKTGLAKRIQVKNMLLGPIDAVTSLDSMTTSLSILGQTVIVVDGTTRLEGLTFAALAAGPVVKVHGLAQSDGSIQASYIELMAPTLADYLTNPDHYLEVKGPVSNLSGSTFSIYALNVDASGITLPDGLAEGSLVEVRGRDYDTGTTTLTAASVNLLSAGLGITAADGAQIEGYITALDTTQQTFVVDGQTVSYASALFLGGVEADLTVNAKVEAVGPIANSILHATKIIFKDGIRIEANIASVTPVNGSGTFTLQGLPGLTFTAQEGVTWYNHVAGFSALAAGDALKVRARVNGSSLLVTRIDLEQNSPAEQIKLRGPVDSFDAVAKTVTIIGFVVDTSTIPDANFKIGETSVGSAEFFAALQAGMMVKVNGQVDLTSSQVTWNEIEIDE